MGIGKIHSKNAAKGKTSLAAKLTVNKYENADMALNLIAHICTADTDLSVEDNFKVYKDYIVGMRDRFLEEANINEGDSVDRLPSLQEACMWPFQALPDEMEKTNGIFSQTIAVCGGYSSGKSSFLNNLLETKNALPTGIEPVSMINTYINFPKDARQLTVKGRNVKGKFVLLNKEVLDCIQHSSKNKIYVGSVLDSLYIDLPLPASKEYLKGLTFIDTPGYNNSQNANQENNVRDSDTAMKAMRDADAIIWCVDITNGTIPKSDIDMLNRVAEDGKNSPLVIVLTRLDKKRDQAVSIMKGVENTCKNSLKLTPVDILAYSSADGSALSLSTMINGKKNVVSSSLLLGSTFDILKKKGLQPHGIEYWTGKIRSYFNQEIDACDSQMEYLEQQRIILADAKDKAYRNEMKQRDRVPSTAERIRNVLIHSCSDLFDDKKKLLDIIEQILKESGYEIPLDQQYKDVVSLKKEFRRYLDFLKKEAVKTVQLLNDCAQKALGDIGRRMRKMQEMKEEHDTDVFSSIAGDNVPRFLACFSEGVRLTDCNEQGFSPVTFAARCSNYAMVKFFIRHNVDLSLKDQRGYNALETAAIYHCQDICELIVKARPNLVYQSQPLDRLADNTKFMDWISNLKN